MGEQLKDGLAIAGLCLNFMKPIIHNGRELKAIQIMGDFYWVGTERTLIFKKGDYIIRNNDKVYPMTKTRFKKECEWVRK